MRFLILVLLFPAICWSASASHCRAEEKTYFSCVTKSKGRILSVCGTQVLSEPASYLQYRFGLAGKPDLEYPADRNASIQQFRFYHYVRPKVSRIGLTFQSGDFAYTVYDDFEGDIQPEQQTSGVTVSKNGTNTETDIACTGEVTNHLNELESFVRCDADNAIADCPDQEGGD